MMIIVRALRVKLVMAILTFSLVVSRRFIEAYLS